MLLLQILDDVITSKLVQVAHDKLLLAKILIRVRQTILILLNLLDFLKVIMELFGGILSIHPALSLFNDLAYHIVFYDLLDVDTVMHVPEDAALESVLDFHIIKKLQPQVL